MPMRFAVRITRHAISPRLAIRILRNTLALPGRLALFEERGDAFASVGGGADLGDAPRRVGLQRIVDRPARDVAHEVLDAGMRGGAAREQMVEQLADERVEPGGRRERRKETDAQGFFGTEHLRGEEVAARRASADRPHYVGADGRGRKAELRLRETELRLRRSDGDIARRDEPRAAGERRAVYARD